MNAPRHLWSGDWEQESAEAARRLDRQRRYEQPVEEPIAPPPPPRQQTFARPPHPRPERLSAPRVRLRRPRPGARVLAVAAIVAVAGAFAALALIDPGGGGSADASRSTAWIGVQMQSVPVGRVIISAVVPGGPADRAGLGPGDLITQVAGRPVRVPGDVTAAIGHMHPGQRVAIQVQRGPLTFAANVTLTDQPSQFP